jgi:hypothetical protein
MLKRAIIILQDDLRSRGFYAGPSNGLTSPALVAGADRALRADPAGLPPGALGFSEKRRVTMEFQRLAERRGIDCKPIDGYWGPVTLRAYENLVSLLDHGAALPPFRDDPPSDANPHSWPRDTGNQQAMRDFYGEPGRPPMTTIRCPWTLRLAWDLTQKTTKISINSRVAASAQRVLDKVFAHYGEAGLNNLRLDLYGGCFAPRRKRGGTSWSTHAWAVALDFDPDHNKLEWGRDRASMDDPAYDFWWHSWEEEGWVSLGRSRNFDWMHVQAARL